jgi:putative endonuclease
MVRGGAVYMMTNKSKTVIYTGVTSNLRKRIYQHKNKLNPNCFTARYNAVFLVYYQVFQRIEDAIFKEKQIKAGSRARKEYLINSINPEWKDLSGDFI